MVTHQVIINNVKHFSTRLHSSRMRTARALTVSPSMLCTGEGCTWSRGVYLVPGGTWSGGCTCSWGGTWFRGCVPGPRGVYLVLGGVPGPRGVPGPGGCTWSWVGGVPGPGGCTWSRGVYLVPGGCTWSRGYLVLGGVPGQVLPPVHRITDACKNITFPQLRCGR